MKRIIFLLILLSIVWFGAAIYVLAQESPLHPVFPLLDAEGQPVTTSGNPISTLNTCGNCHDTTFITQHTLHGDGGRTAAGVLPPDQLATTDVEMNCFLCHTTAPNNAARLAALDAGQGEWANTATLTNTGIVQQTVTGYSYNPDAFDAAGALKPEYITIQDPRSDNCGACHGLAHLDNQVPLSIPLGDERAWRTFSTGQVISPQRITNSGSNISGRSDLTRTWDVHAERVLNCVDCHYSLNNPIFAQPNAAAAPEHLAFDPRRADFGDYLERPSHEFAAGSDTMRSCDSCHNAQASHTWLPYREQHTDQLACESCHVPYLYAPALAERDATVVRLDGTPVDTYRGVDGGLKPLADDPVTTLITGYQPVLLQQTDADGSQSLAPYNLVTVWYWVAGDPAQPVSSEMLRAAYLTGDGYAPEITAAFDADGDGGLTVAELALDTDAKVALITERLKAQGLDDPRIVGEVIPYAIHHNVIGGEWAVRECQSCHSESSRLVTMMPLGNRMPGGSPPALKSDGTVQWNGTVSQDSTGTLTFSPETQTPVATLYLFGRDSVQLIDMLGVLLVVATSLAVTAHAALRVISARRHPTSHTESGRQRAYMYTIYERQWHWLQTFVIFGLTFTGMVIHKPEYFSLFSFAWMVDVHNIFAALLVINAALALFYHLASGEIKQFIPRPYGFFDNMIEQALYYLRGIFRGDPHPFAKNRDHKMNPIQQMSYLILLNVLLPLQILTGALMWGIEQFQPLRTALGGLPVLGPFHTLIAWLLVTFIIIHVYMTTTGHTPLENLQAMVMGYEDVDSPPAAEAQPKTT